MAIECFFLIKGLRHSVHKKGVGVDSGMTLTETKLIGAKEMINIQKSY
jgi:hypothetical protein